MTKYLDYVQALLACEDDNARAVSSLSLFSDQISINVNCPSDCAKTNSDCELRHVVSVQEISLMVSFYHLGT